MMADESHDYDVALSFAGEDRPFAEYIARRLRALGLRVFYDGFEKATLWGKNLYESFHHVYSERAEYCVLIVSKHYAAKKWTRKEWHSAQQRALRQPEDYILPIRLDDTDLPGLAHTIGYLDGRTMESDEIVDLLIHKIAVRLEAKTHRLVPNIGISGSHPDETLHEFCRDLGRKLVIAGYRIVSGGTKHVGYQVSLGAYEYLQETLANFYAKRELIVTYTNESHPDFPPVQFGTPIPVTQTEVEVYRSEFIRRIDFVVSISGGAGTWKEYQLAKNLGKPVVPLATTGGSAARIWVDIRDRISEVYAGRLSANEFDALNRFDYEGWSAYASAVTAVINKLTRSPRSLTEGAEADGRSHTNGT